MWFRLKTSSSVGHFYLEQLYGPAVLLLSAQLSNLDEDRPRVTRILRLKTGWQFPALVSLVTANSKCTNKSRSVMKHTILKNRPLLNPLHLNRNGFSSYNRTWLVYMARRALLRSMACSCFFASLYSTPSAFVNFTFFFESNTFWSYKNRQRFNKNNRSFGQLEVSLRFTVKSQCYLYDEILNLVRPSSTHLVYCNDIVGSHSKQPHIWGPAN